MQISFNDLVVKIESLTTTYFSGNITIQVVGSDLIQRTPSKAADAMQANIGPLAPLANNIAAVVANFSDEMIALRCAEAQRMKLLLASVSNEMAKFQVCDPKLLALMGAWQSELFTYLATNILTPPTLGVQEDVLEGAKAKRTRIDTQDVNMAAVITALSGMDIGVKSDRDTIVFEPGIIDFPVSEAPIGSRFKPFDPNLLTNCICDTSLLQGADEVLLFGAVAFESIEQVSAEMRRGGYSGTTATYPNTPAGRCLAPTDIITPDKAAGLKSISPWRKLAAEKVAQHIALFPLLEKIQQLFSLDKVTQIQAYKIAALVLEHDKNPLVYAWQWIVFALQKQGVYVFKKHTLHDAAGLFFISTETQQGQVYLWMQLSIDVTGVYIAEQSVIDAVDPVMSIKLSCKINLESFAIERHAHSVVVKNRVLSRRVGQAARNLSTHFSAWQCELKSKLLGKQSCELIYLYPLSLPIPESLWSEYKKLSITPRELLQHVEKNIDNIGDVNKQAAKDYERMVAINGIAGFKACETERGDLYLKNVEEYIRSCFSGSWQAWQQNILNIFIAQQFFNPTESLWYQLLTILDTQYNLQLQTRFGVDGTDKLYNLTKDSRGQFCLNSGFQVFKIYNKHTDEEFDKKERLISMELQIVFPNSLDEQFTFNKVPEITIYAACEPFLNKLITALYAMSCRTPGDFGSIDCTKIIASLRVEREKYGPSDKSAIRCKLF